MSGAKSVRCTVAEIVDEVEGELALSGLLPARGEAVALVSACVRQPRWWPSLHRGEELSDDEHTAILHATQRVCEGMPFAYAVGHADFRTLTLEVDAGVLIPRPETELLVELVLHSRGGIVGGVVADVGTGSGAIALSLAAEGTFDRVIATDVSADALAVARRNAAAHSAVVGEHVEFRAGDVLAPLAGERLDILVSNPPYIAFSELDDLPALVRNWEPPNALVCPEEGLSITRSIVLGAGRLLVPSGFLALEVDSRRARDVMAMVRDEDGYGEITLHRDLTGRDRFVTARWKG